MKFVRNIFCVEGPLDNTKHFSIPPIESDIFLLLLQKTRLNNPDIDYSVTYSCKEMASVNGRSRMWKWTNTRDVFCYLHCSTYTLEDVHARGGNVELMKGITTICNILTVFTSVAYRAEPEGHDHQRYQNQRHDGK